jgi:hypothetical protein
MSQFADGGLLATKPYVSSAAYIDRMSDYCKGCAYDKQGAHGRPGLPVQRPVLGLFCAPRRPALQGNPRLAMVYTAPWSSAPPAPLAAPMARNCAPTHAAPGGGHCWRAAAPGAGFADARASIAAAAQPCRRKARGTCIMATPHVLHTPRAMP